MQDSMYSALFGAMSQEHRLNIIANNLANVNTTGYKQDRFAFENTMIEFAHDRIMQPVNSLRDPELFPKPVHLSKVRLADERVDFSQGGMKDTGGPLDLAIMGQGFFKVQTEVGEFYTRNGNFQVNPDGTLVTSQGFPVLAGGGPVQIPANAQVRVDATGAITANGEDLGQLDVVTLDDLTAMRKYGNNLFTIDEQSDAQEIPAEDAQVAQGYLEQPNVNVVEEMVNMIEAHRAFEAYQKVISTSSETDKNVIMKVGKT